MVISPKGIIAAAVLFGAGSGLATAQAEHEQLYGAARAFLQMLVRGDFAAAENTFDATMRTALPEQQLNSVWQQVTAQAGAYQEELGIQSSPTGAYDVVVITCKFEKGDLAVKVVYNAQKQVSGLFFSPADKDAPGPQTYTPPSYANRTAFDETDVTVGSGQWSLPGTLTIPKGKGPFPAVVLVHGSGPNDRDETIGPNKVFQDLAWGLASQGIAVLRYDKRTRVHRDQLKDVKNFTVEQEVMEDAQSAVALLQNTKAIDRNRVFVLGHSEGGYLAPRIATTDQAIAGIIIMAGLARHIEDAIVSQTQYLQTHMGTPTDAAKQQLQAIQAEADNIRNVKPGDTGIVFHAPPSYWLDLKNYDPVATAEKLHIPILILQGERDYQVTVAEDYNKWKAGLGSHKNVTLKSYPPLNHLFEAGEGPSMPSEYERAGNVAEPVVKDIAQWIEKQGGK